MGSTRRLFPYASLHVDRVSVPCLYRCTIRLFCGANERRTSASGTRLALCWSLDRSSKFQRKPVDHCYIVSAASNLKCNTLPRVVCANAKNNLPTTSALIAHDDC